MLVSELNRADREALERVGEAPAAPWYRFFQSHITTMSHPPYGFKNAARWNRRTERSQFLPETLVCSRPCR